jgi:hypothetical protein
MRQLYGSVAARLKSLQHEPRDAFDLYFEPEAMRLIRLMGANAAGSSDLANYVNQRTGLSYVLPLLRITVAEGIVLGSQYPQLTEILLSRRIDPVAWRRWHTAGFDIPTFPPEAKTVRRRQTQTFFLIKPYVSALRPDLMETLKLHMEVLSLI